MVGSKHLFTVITQSWNIFPSRVKICDKRIKDRNFIWDENCWTVPSCCLLARCCAWLKEKQNSVNFLKTFSFPATIIYNVARVDGERAIFVLLHYFGTVLRPTTWAWVEKQVFWGTPLHWRHFAYTSKVEQTWIKLFPRDWSARLLLDTIEEQCISRQIEKRKFLQNVGGFDYPLMSGVDWVYCARKMYHLIYLQMCVPFPELPRQDLCLNYWKETRSSFGGFSFQFPTFAVLWFDSFVWFVARLPSGLTCMLLYLGSEGKVNTFFFFFMRELILWPTWYWRWQYWDWR